MKIMLEKELEELNNNLIEMGTLIEIAIDRAITALKTQDSKLAKTVIQYKEKVSKIEKIIESDSMRILLSYQPVAKDLRLISTALKLIVDMTRISVQAFEISEITLQLLGKDFIKEPDSIVEMALKTVNMVKNSLDAFVNNDKEIAEKVILADDEIDEMFISVRDDLINLINENKNNGEQAINFIMIAKYLERIADHAANISGWVIYYITGEYKKVIKFDDNNS